MAPDTSTSVNFRYSELPPHQPWKRRRSQGVFVRCPRVQEASLLCISLSMRMQNQFEQQMSVIVPGGRVPNYPWHQFCFHKMWNISSKMTKSKRNVQHPFCCLFCAIGTTLHHSLVPGWCLAGSVTFLWRCICDVYSIHSWRLLKIGEYTLDLVRSTESDSRGKFSR